MQLILLVNLDAIDTYVCYLLTTWFLFLDTLLHFAWVVDDAKCIVVTRVCVSVRGRTPKLLHGPGCNLGVW